MTRFRLSLAACLSAGIFIASPAWADNCGSLQDCYGAAEAAITVIGAIAIGIAVAGIVSPLLVEAAGTAAVEAAGSVMEAQLLIDPALATGSEAAEVAEEGLAAGEAYRYEVGGRLSSIERDGLPADTYATTTGELTPFQAQLDLALAPNWGLRDTLVRIDLNGLRDAGYEIPKVTAVAREYNMPGGGHEMVFPYKIPPKFISVIRK